MEPSTTHPVTRWIVFVALPSKQVWMSKRWRHQFMSSHKLVPLTSNLACHSPSGKTQSFHTMFIEVGRSDLNTNDVILGAGLAGQKWRRIWQSLWLTYVQWSSNLWLLKTVVFPHWCLIGAVLLFQKSETIQCSEVSSSKPECDTKSPTPPPVPTRPAGGHRPQNKMASATKASAVSATPTMRTRQQSGLTRCQRHKTSFHSADLNLLEYYSMSKIFRLF